jgi:predicted phage terminase large subunit-like protein
MVFAPKDFLSWPDDKQVEYLALLEFQHGGEWLDDFIRRVMPQWPPPAHMAPLRRLIEETRRREVRAVVSLPRRHAKTMTLMPGLAWRVVRDPGCLNAFCGYGDQFASDKSKEIRQLAELGGANLRDDATAANLWRTPYGGGVLATGIGGPLTGFGVTGLMVVDDPIKNPQEAESKLMRDRVWEWFTRVAYPTVEPGGSIIVCATRWHEDDLIGRIKQGGLGETWECIELPAVMDTEGKAADERLDDRVHALWPEHYPLDKLAKLRATINEHGWWSMYQQQPRPRGDVLFGEPARFDLATFDIRGCRVVNAIDPAASEKTHADYSVCVTAAAKGRGDEAQFFILDVQRWQIQVPELVERLLEVQKSHRWGKGAALLVEAVGGFKAVPQMLRAAAPELRILEVQPKGDKFTRSQPLAAAWRAGLVHVPQQAPWLASYLHEMQAFTGVQDAHDDQVDATVHAFEYLRGDVSDMARGRALASW